MNIKHVPFTRLGNKVDDIKYFKDLIPTDVKTVVEPFAGSFAISRILFDPKKYKIYINDNDSSLFFILKNISLFIKTLYETSKYIRDKNPTQKELKEYVDELEVDDAIKTQMMNRFIVRGYVKVNKTDIDYTELETFLKDVNITNLDFQEVMEKFKNQKTAFLFVDPPYFGSDNSNYESHRIKTNDNNEIIDNTFMYVYLAEFLKKCKCKIMIVINDNAILRYLFKDYIKTTYNKIYQISKKKDKLMVITNY